MKNHISTFSNLMLKYLVFAFLVGFIFGGCKTKEEVINPPSEYVNIPDKNFEKALIQLKIDNVQDGKILRASLLKVTSLSMSGYGKNTSDKIKDLTGIGEFVNLKILNFDYNVLVTIKK
jgi:hypothetical protein